MSAHGITGYEPLLVPKPVTRDVWVVDGPRVTFFGQPFPTRMTLLRLPGGDLLVHSPVLGTPELLAACRALGPVKHILAPNWIHYVHLPAWQAAFPDAHAYAAPGVVERASSRGVPLKDVLPMPPTGDGPAAAWLADVATLLVEGNPVHREVVLFHHASRTLVLTDLVENLEPAKQPAWTRPLLALAGNRDPDGKAPLDMRMAFRFGHGGKGLGMLREAVLVMLAWKPERIILSHGRWYAQNAEAELRRAFRWAFPGGRVP